MNDLFGVLKLYIPANLFLANEIPKYIKVREFGLNDQSF